MDRQKELEIVISAYFLEEKIANLEKEKSSLYCQKPEKPEEPRQIEVTLGTPKYPPIDTSRVEAPKLWKYISFLGLAIVVLGTLVVFSIPSDALFMLGAMVMWPGGIALTVYSLIRGKREKKKLIEEYIERVKNSPEYINKCRQIDEENIIRYEKLKKDTYNAYIRNLEQYKTSLQEYNEFLLPQWTEEINALQTTLNDTHKTLDELYNTNIIASPYRNLSALAYIADFLRTSSASVDFSLKFAIERFEKSIDQELAKDAKDQKEAELKILEAILQNQQYANWLNEQMIEISNQGNETLRKISNWQKVDIGTRAYERLKERRNAKR